MNGQEEDGGVGEGEVVLYSDYRAGEGAGGGLGKECTFAVHCLQKQKCDWNLFCRCYRGTCVSMRTNSAIGKRDCRTEKQVRTFLFFRQKFLS